ncbi:MAG: hypothetical protein HYZ33_02195 [Ignavibacteriales bacterium]|nr:hypothetical protein [Ignavibacteriales bacterium]
MKTFISLHHLILTLSVCVLFMIAGTGCDKDSDLTNSTNQPSRVEGTVVGEPNSASVFGKIVSGIEGATVTLAQVQANGSLKTVSSASVQTDMNGKFILETSLNGATNLVVVASKGLQTWKAVISSDVRNAVTVYSQPLTVETTVEAEVYQQVVANGEQNTVTTADIATYIDADVAASVNSQTSVIIQIAFALTAQVHAADSLLLSTTTSATFAKLQTVKRSQIQAQASLEAAVYLASNNQSAIASAWILYYQAVANAYTSAGISIEAYAKARSLSAAVITKLTSTISSEVQLAISKRASVQKAIALEQAYRANFSALGASQGSLNALVSAKASLETSIETASTVNQVGNAFVAFHDTVIAHLKVSLTMYASAVASVDNSVNSQSGAKATLQASFNAAVSTQAMVSACSSFFVSVRTTVQAALNNAPSVQLNATTEIILLSNLMM